MFKYNKMWIDLPSLQHQMLLASSLQFFLGLYHASDSFYGNGSSICQILPKLEANHTTYKYSASLETNSVAQSTILKIAIPAIYGLLIYKWNFG